MKFGDPGELHGQANRQERQGVKNKGTVVLLISNVFLGNLCALGGSKLNLAISLVGYLRMLHSARPIASGKLPFLLREGSGDAGKKGKRRGRQGAGWAKAWRRPILVSWKRTVFLSSKSRRQLFSSVMPLS